MSWRQALGVKALGSPGLVKYPPTYTHIGVILVSYWGYIGVILSLYWDYIRVILGFYGV